MSNHENKSFQNMYREYMKFFNANNHFKINKTNLLNFKEYFKECTEKKSDIDAILQNIEIFSSITDIDPDFYSIVKNDQMVSSENSKSNMNEVKACSLLHLKTGYINDEILKIKHSFALEMRLFKIMCQKHNRFVECFEKFLIEDYQSSMLILQKSKEKTVSFQMKLNTCKELENQHRMLKSKVQTLTEKCQYANIYQTFVYQISPLLWLPQSIKNMEPETNENEESMIKKSNKYRTLITELKNKIDGDKEAQLPFTEPKQLKMLLENIEMQNLTSWMNAETLSENCENIKVNIEVIKDTVHYEFNDVEQLLKNVSDIIEWEEMRARELKQKINVILNGILRMTLCSKKSLRLNICIDDIFNQLVFKNISFEMESLMTIIENEYEANVKELDCVNVESAKFVEKQKYKDDSTMMKQAQEAAKKLKMLESLSHHLKKSLPNNKLDNVF